MIERTLIILKPDAIQRGLSGRILARFEEKGLKVVAAKFTVLPRALVRRIVRQLRLVEVDSPALAIPERSVRWQPGIYICGDHRDTASIQGAMVSGRRAAEALLADGIR